MTCVEQKQQEGIFQHKWQQATPWGPVRFLQWGSGCSAPCAAHTHGRKLRESPGSASEARFLTMHTRQVAPQHPEEEVCEWEISCLSG